MIATDLRVFLLGLDLPGFPPLGMTPNADSSTLELSP